MYTYTHYSDATYAEQVGYEEDTCNFNGVGRTNIVGTYTSYVRQQPLAYCTDGQFEFYGG
jgi:hypothetical protein